MPRVQQSRRRGCTVRLVTVHCWFSDWDDAVRPVRLHRRCLSTQRHTQPPDWTGRCNNTSRGSHTEECLSLQATVGPETVTSVEGRKNDNQVSESEFTSWVTFTFAGRRGPRVRVWPACFTANAHNDLTFLNKWPWVFYRQKVMIHGLFKINVWWK